MEEENEAKFVYYMPHLEDADIQVLMQTIARRVIRALKKLGHFRDESEAFAEEGEGIRPDTLNNTRLKGSTFGCGCPTANSSGTSIQ